MSEITARLFHIQKFSLHDGPGIRTVVFFKGCPLRCLWCSNPESQSKQIQILYNKQNCIHCGRCAAGCPFDAISIETQSVRIDHKNCTACLRCIKGCPQRALTSEGKDYTIDEIIKICLQDRDFYEESGGGVTLSGGEALLNPQPAIELLRQLKQQGVHTAIETTGYVSSSAFEQTLPFLDLLLFDVKHYDRKRHFEGTGVYPDRIFQNLNTALSSKKHLIVRIPVIPDFNDHLNDAKGFLKLFLKYGVTNVNLLPFHQFGEKKYEMLCIPYTMQSSPALTEENLKEYQSIFINGGINCYF